MQTSTDTSKNQNLRVSALSSTATLQDTVLTQTNIKEQGSQPGSAIVSPDASQTALSELKPEEVLLDQDVAPSRRSKGMMSLYLIWMPCFLLTASNGYAHGGMTTINSMTQFQAYFNFTGLGLDTSLVFAALPFGAIATFWLAPLISDNYGRVMGIRVGILTNITGASLIAGAQNVPMLMVGRVLLGVGDAIVSNSCGPYIAETSPAHVRGQFMGSLSVLFCTGTLLACCAGIAGEAIKHTWGWRVVIFGQLAILLIGLVLSGLMKETPRWLVAKGRNEEALAFLTRFHGSGVETAYVKLEYDQIKAASTPLPKGIRDRWNFKTLLGKKGDFHRLSLALMMTTVGQLCGNGLLYFMPQLAGQVGITSVQMQLVMPVIANVVSIFTSLYGSMLWDKYGRRPSLIYGSLGLAVAYAAAMVASSQTGVESYEEIQPSSNQDASRAGIAFLIIAQGIYGLTIATSVWMYPSECLATVQRSTAMGLSTLVFKICLFVNLFAVPIALERIGYWTYLPFILANPIISFIWYMIAVETKGVNLEELDEFFQHPHAVKRSVERARLHRREQKQARAEAV